MLQVMVVVRPLLLWLLCGGTTPAGVVGEYGSASAVVGAPVIPQPQLASRGSASARISFKYRERTQAEQDGVGVIIIYFRAILFILNIKCKIIIWMQHFHSS